MKKILFLGHPNVGKTTLYNFLTDSNAKVCNYSGATVSSCSAPLLGQESETAVVDLPGVKSLSPGAPDEAVSIQALLQEDYHGVVVVGDAHNLLPSVTLLLELSQVLPSRHLLFVINKCDSGTHHQEIANFTKNFNKVATLTTQEENAEELQVLQKTLAKFASATPLNLKKALPVENDALNLLTASPKIEALTHHNYLKSLQEIQGKAQKLLLNHKNTSAGKRDFSAIIDGYLLNPIIGGLVFLACFYLLFHALYTWSGPLMDGVDSAVGWISDFASQALPPGLFQDLIVDGLIAGVGSVVIFLPQIMILFFLFYLLEHSGYISRASIITDRIMGVFGLSGKAFLPYLSGFACSIPGIMATRTIKNKHERMATLLTLPMITCSARLPVYILLIGAFVPDQKWGPFHLQALSFFFLYFLGGIVTLIMAKIFRLSFFRGQEEHFFMDLPKYRLPSFYGACKHSWSKGLLFLKKAGSVIMIFSVVIWALSSFPRINESTKQQIKKEQYAQWLTSTEEINPQEVLENHNSATQLEHSLLGRMGKTIEPLVQPLGLDWKAAIGILVSFGARELFVATMGTLYALGDVDEESTSLRERLKNDVDPRTGKKTMSLAAAWALLIFFAFSLQCTSTLAIIKQETGGWKWAIFAFGYMLVLAYGGGYLAHQIFI